MLCPGNRRPSRDCLNAFKALNFFDGFCPRTETPSLEQVVVRSQSIELVGLVTLVAASVWFMSVPVELEFDRVELTIQVRLRLALAL